MCKKYYILITKISVIVIMIIDASEYRGNQWSQTSHLLPDQSYELKTNFCYQRNEGIGVPKAEKYQIFDHIRITS